MQLKTQEELKKYSILSKVGLAIFISGLLLGIVEMTNNISLHLLGVSLICLITGWLVFSVNHTKIAINKIQKITQDYIQNINK